MRRYVYATAEGADALDNGTGSAQVSSVEVGNFCVGMVIDEDRLCGKTLPLNGGWVDMDARRKNPYTNRPYRDAYGGVAGWRGV